MSRDVRDTINYYVQHSKATKTLLANRLAAGDTWDYPIKDLGIQPAPYKGSLSSKTDTKIWGEHPVWNARLIRKFTYSSKLYHSIFGMSTREVTIYQAARRVFVEGVFS